MDSAQDGLLQFPCAFPLKIMALAGVPVPALLDIVQRHAPDYDAATLETRASSGGKYIGLTCTINATSKAQLDALYRELCAHPQVKVVL
jgi:putative lipoic acid-binding regulatory protein